MDAAQSQTSFVLDILTPRFSGCSACVSQASDSRTEFLLEIQFARSIVIDQLILERQMVEAVRQCKELLLSTSFTLE